MLFRRSNFSRCASGRAPAAAVFALALAALMLGAVASPEARAATALNAQAPLGINLAGVSSFSSESPFMNVLANNSGGWTTVNSSGNDTGEEAYLQLDSDGYVKSLVASPTPAGGQKFNGVQVTLNTTVSYGQFTVTYQGSGTLTFGLSAKVVSSSAGQYVINITQNGGANITINSTDPTNYIRNIAVVPTGSTSGQLFNPAFLSRIQSFRVLRFMDWFSINTSKLSAWANRPQQTNAFWGGPYGVPVEVAVQAANAISADAWLNIPTLATNDYVTQMAGLVHTQLGSTQKAYVEFSNEVWNSGFTQNGYAAAQGKALWPSAGAYADYALNWYGMRVAQICDIWKSVWGADASRVVCVMGAQAAVAQTAIDALSTPLWTGSGNGPAASHGIGVIAIAPYFAYEGVPAAWTLQSDGGLSMLFQAMTTQNDPAIPVGGFLGEASRWELAYAPVSKTYNLPIVAYEGGQSFLGLEQSTALQNLYYAANRDSRMATVTLTYLQQWQANGGTLFNYYNDISPAGVYGGWGALESIAQAVTPLTSAPPKWQALQSFVTGTACWWSGCGGTTGTTGTPAPKIPMAPSNVSVQ